VNKSTDCAGVSQPGCERLRSLDAYRGLVMLAIASHGLGLASAAEHFPNSQPWQAVACQLEHVPWVGCVVWDMIQPSFMFLVCVAMAYSCAKRKQRGDSHEGLEGSDEEASQHKQRSTIRLILQFRSPGLLATRQHPRGGVTFGLCHQTTVRETVVPPIRRLTRFAPISASRDTFCGTSNPSRETVAASDVTRANVHPPSGSESARSIKATYFDTLDFNADTGVPRGPWPRGQGLSR
jgi:hypothetical protein